MNEFLGKFGCDSFEGIIFTIQHFIKGVKLIVDTGGNL